MTHLPYIVACYGLGIGIPVLFAVTAWQRLTAAQRRLRVLEVRR